MTESLFISYNGALEPLLQSQGIAYIRGLTKNGLKFVLLTFEKRDNLKDKKAVNELNEYFRKNDIEWHKLAYHKFPPVLSTVYDIFIGLIYTTYIVIKKKIAVVHARSYVPAVIAYFLNRWLKVKFIFDMRGMMIDEYAEGGIFKKEGMIYKFGKIHEKILLKSADRIIVLTEKIKEVISNFDYLQDKVNVKIDVIPCCVDLQKFKYDRQKSNIHQRLNLKDKFIFVYTGSVGTWYFLDGMLDLFMVTKRMHPEAHFLFLNHRQKDVIASSILNKKLDLDDFSLMDVAYDNVPDYISESDVGVIFYKQTFSRLACCPIKFAEYLACGIPVILTSGIGDIEEIVASNHIGAVIKNFTEENYKNAINQILELKKDGLMLRKRCRTVAERLFSLEDGIKKYGNIYKNLIAE